ncbi:MAG: histidine phosphatase family protein [Acidimicrobiales bacterium]
MPSGAAQVPPDTLGAPSGSSSSSSARTPGGDGPTPPRLVVVRHGATEWSRSGRHTGRTDLPLLDEGRRQAEELGRRLAGHDFALVLTSPLERARQTCEIAGFGARAQECDDLHEWDYGEYEGLTTDEIWERRPGWSLWEDGVPGGESAQDVAVRADRVIALARSRRGDVLVFAHAHVLRVMGARWVGLDARAGALFTLAPATVSVLGWERDVAVVARWNDAAGAPLV